MNEKINFDTKDLKIIEILCKDSTTPVQQIAAEVGLTNNPCWRRIKRLKETGVIQNYTINLDRRKLGYTTLAFVALKIERHSPEWLKRFSEAVNSIPEITACHRMSGAIDYMLTVSVRDLPHYDQIYQTLIKKVDGLVEVSSTFSMEEIKG